MPRWLFELLTNLAMNNEDKKAMDGYRSMRAIAPTLHYDIQLTVEVR